MEALTQARLKQLFHYCEKTGVFTRLIAPGKRSDLIGTVAGTPQNQGYILIDVDNKTYKAHRLAWLYIYGAWPTTNIDHRNHNKADNAILNLREATKSQNEQNKGVRSNNTSGITGVYKHIQSGRWMSYIKLNGKRIHLGLFKNKDDAVNARKQSEYRLFGEFAIDNSMRVQHGS